MNRRALQLALREMQSVLANRYSRVGMLLAVVLLAVSGPFGTFESFTVGQRFVYWGAMVLASYVTGQGAAKFFLTVLSDQIVSRWPRAIVAGLLTSLPVTIVVLLVNGLAQQHVEVEESLLIWFYCVLVTLAVVVTFVGLSELLARPSGVAALEGDTAGPGATTALPPAIFERVPLQQRGRLLALTVEDHYVDIVTDRGKTLVLMRLADAIREAAPVPGLQIHRSHWVALAAVTRAHRSDGKVMLELTNGLRLPVSRGYLPAAREAGLVT